MRFCCDILELFHRSLVRHSLMKPVTYLPPGKMYKNTNAVQHGLFFEKEL